MLLSQWEFWRAVLLLLLLAIQEGSLGRALHMSLVHNGGPYNLHYERSLDSEEVVHKEEKEGSLSPMSLVLFCWSTLLPHLLRCWNGEGDLFSRILLFSFKDTK